MRRPPGIGRDERSSGSELPLGHLDSIVNHIASGWAHGADDSDAPAMLDVFIDGEIIGETVADLFREDLQRQNIREGYAAFNFAIPLNFFDGEEHNIRFAIRDSGEVLQNCPFSFRGTARDLSFIRQRIEWAERAILLQTSRRAQLLASRVRERRKVALLATFHAAPKFLGYHFSLTKMLTDAGFVVLLAHAAGALHPRLGDIDRGDCFLYAKRNLGYDFGSWAIGLYTLSNLFDHIDEIVLINDSVIGLRVDIADVLEQMRRRNADLVGLTDSYDRAYHMQSYFLWLGRNICRSALLQVFMAKYPFSADKDIAIKEGEIGFSRFLLDQGFRAEALYPYERIAGTWLKKAPQLARAIENLPVFDAAAGAKLYRCDLLQKLEAIACSVVNGTPLNPVHFFWDVLVEFGHPFLKREFVMLNPGEVPTYFQLAELLSALPPEIQANVLEIRQIYGGQRVPFIAPRAEPKSLRALERDRRGAAKGGALVA